ncbi:hypothetical protein V1L54_28390 [Streptomyces sp. TRM 70361]|uniref:hypothetical protein n=1 Tax=Streptomyces sp. TRM 70361 TaxID=3116553 RepID=UPI002E7BF21A|nr:hypothetical protein [Streptomyces sp. TRM 70361]MEE1943278.1 hypothetical protein [Streptomyces sp. TRM 70361]
MSVSARTPHTRTGARAHRPGAPAGARTPGPGDGRPAAGIGRITLARTGGGAGPDWGAYVLAYTSTLLPDGSRAALVAATTPDDPALDPAWGLRLAPTRWSDPGNARRPVWEYAAAAAPPKSATEPVGRWEQRLAVYLLTAALTPRLIPTRATVDLPTADWKATIDRTVHLDVPHAGHTRVSIGRLTACAPKENLAR